MSQSLSHVLLHVIFSTKNREPFFENETLRKEAHGYLVGTLRSIECPALIVGGVADHIHALCRLGRTTTIAGLVEAMKIESSKLIKRHELGVESFSWQNGYAAFSVSVSNVEQLKRYIEQQESHHRVKTFQDELREFLHRHRVEFDERYVWD
jgi:putative transposase